MGGLLSCFFSRKPALSLDFLDIAPTPSTPIPEDAATRKLAKGLRNGTLTLERATQLLEGGADAKFIATYRIFEEDYSLVQLESESLIQTAVEHHRTADSLDIIRLLLERGADINFKGCAFGPPVELAIIRGRYDVAQMLLDDPDLDLKAAGPLLWRVAFYPLDGSVSSAEKLRMAKRLVRMGGRAAILFDAPAYELPHRDCHHPTALHSFCAHPLADLSSQLDLMDYLIRKTGRCIVHDAEPSTDRTPLYYAARSDSTDPSALRLLLRNGASLRGGFRPPLVPLWMNFGGVEPLDTWKQTRLRAAYRDYLQHDLPMQVSIAVKTALLPARATAPLLDDVTHTIEALIGVGSPPTACIPIGERLFSDRINGLVDGYLSAAYKCIRQASSRSSSSSSREGMCWGLGDVLQEVNEAAREEGWRFGIEL
ncbi:unnamed protein product [Vitrella brassicaformis CCMP3155]|uniref:Uncharacterized protein n=2 Tax=Vitrella brassicaformis TaxID=1169539 RepID=A0A0G4FBI1_VITBC|nr:unnamed protein product [Vitrella brassicaformis CCMP3155]|mmetsp:Transcript_4258/g.11132  ORF Transcript_4258/g.11132 Transcript_4258/m.11132 type:complete len:426 (-) Transcript_4258:1899-3176(-)|eukprot:CEM09987.1 unnamed protein product [Vitrella brassicaformis CCMP3155]